MTRSDFLYFRKLKEQLVKKFALSKPGISQDISAWKGKDIQEFQADLEQKARGRISEKWFYTHLKSNSDKLPRIDILDLLSRYVDYEDWQSFKNGHKISPKTNRGLWIVLIVSAVIAGGVLLNNSLSEQEYAFEVVDAYTGKQIDLAKIRVLQLFTHQSPVEITPDESGIFSIKSQSDTVQFVVNAMYYHADTIKRIKSRFSQRELIRLLPNDYALMIHLYSKSDTNNWMQRRAQLSEIIKDDAMIFQVDPQEELALELYSKHSFINKLTIPSKSLKNIEILDIRFDGNKISHLRFTQKEGGPNE